MSTTAVLRLKRRVTDEPLKALVVSYKRPKLNNGDETDLGQVRQEIFQLSGDPVKFQNVLDTCEELKIVEANDSQSSELIEAGTKRCRQAANMKIHIGDIKLTNRQLISSSRQRQRDRLLEATRSIDKSSLLDVDAISQQVRLNSELPSAAESVFAELAGLVDAVEPMGIEEKLVEEETILCNGVAMLRVKNDNNQESFTYDYYVATTGFGDLQSEEPNLLDRIVNINAFDVGDDKLELLAEESGSDQESTDSNAEDHWGNEYPDEEDLDGIDQSSDEENEDRQEFESLSTRYRDAHRGFLQQMGRLTVNDRSSDHVDDNNDESDIESE